MARSPPGRRLVVVVQPYEFIESRYTQAVERRAKALHELEAARRELQAAQVRAQGWIDRHDAAAALVSRVEGARIEFLKLVALPDGPFRRGWERLIAANSREVAATDTWRDEFSDQPVFSRLHAARHAMEEATARRATAAQQLEKSIAEEALSNAAARVQEQYFALVRRALEETAAERADAKQAVASAEHFEAVAEADYAAADKAVQEFENRLYRERFIDELTGVLNVSRFAADISKAQGAILIAIDLDKFKSVNDEEGHPAGDTLLREFGTFLSETAAAIDGTAYRVGGDEFFLICPNMERRGAARLVDGMREGWARLETRVTMSIGVARFAPALSPEAARKLADDASYASKRAGGNRASIASRGRLESL